MQLAQNKRSRSFLIEFFCRFFALMCDFGHRVSDPSRSAMTIPWARSSPSCFLSLAFCLSPFVFASLLSTFNCQLSAAFLIGTPNFSHLAVTISKIDHISFSNRDKFHSLLPANGNGWTRFVSPSGSDSSRGTIAAPWKTLNAAFARLRSGDTLCLRGGTYPMIVSSGYNQIFENVSGTASNPLTVTNYPGEVAIVQGNTRVQAAYVVFRDTPPAGSGLIFEGPTGQELGLIDIMHSHDVTIDHVEVRGGDYHAGVYQYGGYNIKLLDSYIHDNGRPGYINTDQGVYWDMTTGGGNLISNCVIEHNVSTGIQLYPNTTRVTVEENTIVNNGNYGMEVYGSDDTIVNNIFADNGTVANNPQLKISGGGNHFIDSNIFWSPNEKLRGYIEEGTNQKVTHAFSVDPLFTDPAKHDYHLQAKSPAIGAGNSNYKQSTDRDGVARAKLSLGAYGH